MKTITLSFSKVLSFVTNCIVNNYRIKFENLDIEHGCVMSYGAIKK